MYCMDPARKDEHGNYPKYSFEYRGRTIYLHETPRRCMNIVNQFCREVDELEKSWSRDESEEENPSTSSANVPIPTPEQISLQKKLDDEEFVDYDEDQSEDQEVVEIRLPTVEKEITDLTEVEFVLPCTTSNIPIVDNNLNSGSSSTCCSYREFPSC